MSLRAIYNKESFLSLTDLKGYGKLQFQRGGQFSEISPSKK